MEYRPAVYHSDFGPNGAIDSRRSWAEPNVVLEPHALAEMMDYCLV
jgi:hypothetical protein